VGRAIAQLPFFTLLTSVALTGCAFTALVGYDFSAFNFVGRRPPLRTIAYASFCGFAVGNTVGFSLLSGGSVRFRIYSEAGVRSDDILRVAVFCIVAFGFGVCTVSSLGVLARPELLAGWLGIGSVWLQAAGIATLAGIACWIAFCASRRSFGVWRTTVTIPSAPLVVGQLAISALEIGFASAALYVLLPAHDGFGFLAFLPVYCVATVAGIMSHVPGGLGVFEAVVLFALGDVMPKDQLVGALTVYRLIYYLLPLALAAVFLGGDEVRRHLRRRRVAGVGSREDPAEER
jgi:uncharacterized membrane protein YbhN (UPF0104 family)